MQRNALPDATSKPSPAPKHRRWTIFAAGFLVLALALVVLYTSGRAFSSPLALVVVAAIGLAAVLMQLRLRNRDEVSPVRAPVWLNALGILCALAALFADLLKLRPEIAQVLALAAIGIFAISSAVILHAFRKQRIASK